jgi:RNA polymerase sigma-70 factor, ECF subfamily
VTSALQRARSAAEARLPERSQQETLRALGDRAVADLAHRYATALETGDVDTLLGLLTQDATWCMPPFTDWFQGHQALRAWLVRDPLSMGWRHQVTEANGQLAVAGYLRDSASGRYLAHVIDVLTLDGGKIAASAAFAFFGLPAELP